MFYSPNQRAGAAGAVQGSGAWENFKKMQAVQAVTLATWFCDVCTKWPQSPNKRRFVIKVCDADQLLDPYCCVAHGGVRRVPMVPGEENQSIIEAKG